MNIEDPRERLIESYDHYIEKLLTGDSKLYHITLYNDKDEYILDANFRAFNREHLMFEVGNFYMLENLNVGRIDIEEKKESV